MRGASKIGVFIVMMRAAARPVPAPPLVIVKSVRHAHPVLAAGGAAAGGIEPPLAEFFLVAGTESERLIALHAVKGLVVHLPLHVVFGLRFGHRLPEPSDADGQPQMTGAERFRW